MAIRPGHLLTYEDYAAFPDDGIRREIIGGKVYVTPAATVRHQTLVVRIVNALENHVQEYGGGMVLVAPTDVLLDVHDIVQPDVLFIREADMHVVTEPNIKGSPTLCVEVLSNPRTDRIRKRALYERTGVAVYWIVDPKGDRVEVYRRSGERFTDPAVMGPGDTLTLDDLPGFSLDLAWLFRR